jgi:ATP-dependent DNA ligase
MGFVIEPPVLPMLAKRVDAIPRQGAGDGDGWLFEPKWDGFRAVVFRDGEELLIQSRDGKALDRYFPELREPLLGLLPERCVLDGEIVIAGKGGLDGAGGGLDGAGGGLDSARGGLDFDALQLRIHPAASRVKLLAEQTPASVVFFDLLALGEDDLRGQPLAMRREKLEQVFAEIATKQKHDVLHLTPATRERDVAEDWFRRFEGAGLDGVMAKPLKGVYTPDKRTMLKVKHERDCDCVVAGFRWYKDTKNGGDEAVGSLLLGLYNAAGALQHVGVCASFTAAKRRELVGFLEPYRERALEGHPWAGWSENGRSEGADGQRMPGGQSRWSQGKDLSWVALRPELVAEVAYEHMQGDRFRHLAHFRRWRLDRKPASCTYAQLEVIPAQELAEIFAGAS